MGLADMFGSEDRIDMKSSELFRLMKQAAKAEVLCDIAKVETNPAKAGSIIKKLADKED